MELDMENQTRCIQKYTNDIARVQQAWGNKKIGERTPYAE